MLKFKNRPKKNIILVTADYQRLRLILKKNFKVDVTLWPKREYIYMKGFSFDRIG